MATKTSAYLRDLQFLVAHHCVTKGKVKLNIQGRGRRSMAQHCVMQNTDTVHQFQRSLSRTQNFILNCFNGKKETWGLR